MRELKGLNSQARAKIVQSTQETWMSPARTPGDRMSGERGRADPHLPHYELRRSRCSHVIAADWWKIARASAGPAVDTTVIPKRKTYRQKLANV